MKNILRRFPIQNRNGKTYTTPNESKVTIHFMNHHEKKPLERMKGEKTTTSRLFPATHITTRGTETTPEINDTTKQPTLKIPGANSLQTKGTNTMPDIDGATKQRDAQNAMRELPAKDQPMLCLYNQHPCKG